MSLLLNVFWALFEIASFVGAVLLVLGCGYAIGWMRGYGVGWKAAEQRERKRTSVWELAMKGRL